MSSPPGYFKTIESETQDRWAKLEADPIIAAPWHQLFKQVQSPRHVLSELLQNADDAGATEASVAIDSGVFRFSHNGEDFTQDHFSSLCRFGYSNKRNLHTIGFRGIGFKSTFSLGDSVQLYTPTLSVQFNREKFIVPVWIDQTPSKSSMTTICVKISDEQREREVEKNLREWIDSPISLLFFRSIRKLNVDGTMLSWERLGPGSIPNSERMALHGRSEDPYILFRSKPEEFPEDALEEIRQERMLPSEDGTPLPPTSVEIVLGAKGDLYVVLPTRVRTELPFACNAAFIQDPARLKIKDPETSPTNRWLLSRIGDLAGLAMTNWLGKARSSVENRAKAYDLMTDVNLQDTTLEGNCGRIVEERFGEVIDGKDILLTETGEVVAPNAAVIVPREIEKVWDQEDAPNWDAEGRPLLATEVSNPNRAKLELWQLVESKSEFDVLNTLCVCQPMRPKRWEKLLNLWEYLEPHANGYLWNGEAVKLNIVPAEGREKLCSAGLVVRLGEKRYSPSDEDWQFLGDNFLVLDQNWLRYLTGQRRVSDKLEDEGEYDLSYKLDKADEFLEALELDAPSDTSSILDRVAAKFFSRGVASISEAVRLAHIAAKLGASVGPHFKYGCRDGKLRSLNDGPLELLDGQEPLIDLILPEDWVDRSVPHESYSAEFRSCTQSEWISWLRSEKSGLVPFPSPKRTVAANWMRVEEAREEFVSRGYLQRYEPNYSDPWVRISECDFHHVLVEMWEQMEQEDGSVWSNILEIFLNSPKRVWEEALNTTVVEEAKNGNVKHTLANKIPPSWILRFREKECVPDTNGKLHKPTELLRRTPETEALLGIEPFIHADYDKPEIRRLLDALGVSTEPTGPNKILNRLTSLTAAENPPVDEIEKWYRRLDTYLNHGSSEDLILIKDVFAENALILTSNLVWETSDGVFISQNEYDVPGAETVLETVRELLFWTKIGVADRPNVEIIINWLNGLPKDEVLAEDTLVRVRAILSKYPDRIWDECEYWLSLAGEWRSIDGFSYSASPLSQVESENFFPSISSVTADLTMLRPEDAVASQFETLDPLSAVLKEKFADDRSPPSSSVHKEWTQCLGSCLTRVSGEEETDCKIRELGLRLKSSKWVTVPDLHVIPYVEGEPAGLPRGAEAFWGEPDIYVEDRSIAQLARSVARVLGAAFNDRRVADAIQLCFDREGTFIEAYMEENFDLSRPPLPSQANDESSGIDPVEPGVGWAPTEEPSIDEPTPPATPPEPIDEPASVFAYETDDENRPNLPREEPTEPTGSPSVAPSPQQLIPGIMESYAERTGFTKVATSRFENDVGHKIIKAEYGSAFPWVEEDATGKVIKRYWPVDQCIERKPLEISYEKWELLNTAPNEYSLISLDREDNPMEMNGGHITSRVKQKSLRLYPASYRLVAEND